MKVYLESFGCSASQASAEIMKASVERLGHELWVLILPIRQRSIFATPAQSNTLQSKRSSIRSAAWVREMWKLIVSGCMPEVQLEDILHANPEAHILGVNAISRLGDASFLNRAEKKERTLPRRRTS